MKKKFINTEKIIGRVYSHKLEQKTVKNEASANYGKPFIAGTVEIAVDEEGLNVIPVHFTYETGESKKETYDALKLILESNKVWTAVGKDDAIKVRVDTTLSVNDFIARDGKPVCTKVNEGGFVQIVNMLPEEEQRNIFTVDMLINRITRVEADPERNIDEEYAIIYGGVFSFKNEYLPVDFIVRDPIGINHYESLEPSNSNPVITKLWGKIDCLTKKVITEEESAFGKAAVSSYEKKSKEWVVTGTATQPYDFGDESVMTKEELTTILQNRELVLAEVKRRKEERDNATSAPAATPVVNAEFKF